MRIWGLVFVWAAPVAASAACLEVLESDYEKQAPDSGYAKIVWVATIENQCAASHDAYLDFKMLSENGNLVAKDLAAEVVPPGRMDIAGSMHLAERDLAAAVASEISISGHERPQ